MKAFTSLQQSKKLAEILPLESADMSYSFDFNSETYESSTVSYKDWIVPKYAQPTDGFGQVIPCWSLAALLDVLESEINSEDGETYQLNIEKDGTWWYIEYIERYNGANIIETKSTEELIDVCYEMILKLNELKML